MNYLPALGVLRAPAPSATQSTTRRVQQTVADWLALAVMRHTDLAGGARRIDPLQALGAIEERWLQNQIAYHRTTALKMKRMSTFLEGAANWLSAFVIAFVLVDLLLVAAGLVFDDWFGKKVHELSPFYLFLAAIMPAAIAGANGIRFQSESDRLWERSKVFAAILNEMRDDTASLRKDIDSARGSEDPGSWVSAAALNAESCAQLFLDEVAEWSVLYAKELRHA